MHNIHKEGLVTICEKVCVCLKNEVMTCDAIGITYCAMKTAFMGLFVANTEKGQDGIMKIVWPISGIEVISSSPY